MTEPFELDLLALKLVKIGVRLQAAAFAISERMGTPTLDEIIETTEPEAREAREAMQEIDHFRTQFVTKRSLPWP